MKRCYEAQPPESTKLTLRFTVASDGKLADGALAPLATCVRDAMTRWTSTKRFAPERKLSALDPIER